MKVITEHNYQKYNFVHDVRKEALQNHEHANLKTKDLTP